jgi:hypothetical protein
VIKPIEIPDATREPQAYVAALLAILGDQDPVGVYRQTPNAVRGLCEDLDDAGWLLAPDPGEWNPKQIVGHLLDADIVYGFRWRLALTENNPSYPGYDEKAWSELARPAPPALLQAFTSVREVNVALIASFRPGDWTKTGVHGEQGREDVLRMVSKIAGHDLAHVNQLERAIQAQAATTSPGK